MIGASVPACPSGVFASGTPERRAVSGGVLPPYLFYAPACDACGQMNARALRAAFINYSLYGEAELKGRTVGQRFDFAGVFTSLLPLDRWGWWGVGLRRLSQSRYMSVDCQCVAVDCRGGSAAPLLPPDWRGINQARSERYATRDLTANPATAPGFLFLAFGVPALVRAPWPTDGPTHSRPRHSAGLFCFWQVRWCDDS